jgi:hypothetical protein
MGAQSVTHLKMIVGEKAHNLKVMANEVALQMAKSFNKIFSIRFHVVLKRGDNFEEIEAKKDMVLLIKYPRKCLKPFKDRINRCTSSRRRLSSCMNAVRGSLLGSNNFL